MDHGKAKGHCDAKIIAIQRMREVQTAWSHFDVGLPTLVEGKPGDLLSQLPQEDRRRLQDIPVGLLHSHDFAEGLEALAYGCHDGICFIAIDFRLPLFLRSMNEFLCAQLSPGDPSRDGIASFDDNARGLVSNIGLFDTSTIVQPREVQPGAMSDDGHIAARILTLSQEYLLIAHEYGHFLLEHCGVNRLVPLEHQGGQCVLPSGVSLGIFSKSQMEELSADSRGAELTLAAIHTGTNLSEAERDIATAGMEIFFLILHMMDEVLGPKAHAGVPTHPLGLDRWKSWRRHFSRRLTPRGEGIAVSAKRFMQAAARAYKSGRYGTMDNLSVKNSIPLSEVLGTAPRNLSFSEFCRITHEWADKGGPHKT